MKKIGLLFLILIFGTGFAQKVKKEEKAKDKFESRQPQDMSVPPPPMIAFPASTLAEIKLSSVMLVKT